MPPVRAAVPEKPGGAVGPDTFLNSGYAFQAPAWERLGMRHVLLTEVRGRRREAQPAHSLVPPAGIPPISSAGRQAPSLPQTLAPLLPAHLT